MLITGGEVVSAETRYPADVLVRDEKIVSVGAPGCLSGEPVVDAAGCLVLPGLVDNHTHLAMPFGGTETADDFTSGTAAAAAGGTTTIIDFALQTGGSLERGLEMWHEKARGRACIDYAFHMAVTDPSRAALEEMGTVSADGVTSFKVFMAYKGALMVNDSDMLRILERAAELGGQVLVHAENGDAVDHAIRSAQAAGQVAPKYHAVTRPPVVEAEATSRAIRLASWVGGRPVFVVHVTSKAALREIYSARADGYEVEAETCVQYLTLTVDRLDEPGFEGAKFVCSPPLRTGDDQAALWRALRSAGLSICSTDHAPFRFADQKSLGRDDFAAIPNGLPTIENRLTLLHTSGVAAGKISWPDVVRVTATAPAQQFDLPHKGAIVPGADADIVIFDPRVRWTISAKSQAMAVDYNPYEGSDVLGRAREVYSRGSLVAKDGVPCGKPGRGRYIGRRPVSVGARAATAAESTSATAKRL